MDNLIQQVEAATAARDQALKAWQDSLREAATVHTLAQVAQAAGVTRARVSQIVGPTGRRPGRPSAVPDETLLAARLAELDARWDRFIAELAHRYMPDERTRKQEQLYRNTENARAKRQAAGVTRTGKRSGSSGRKSRARPTVTAEARRFAETFALRYLEENRAHPICVKVLGEIDEAAGLRQQLAAIQDARVSFLHD